ncbi:MAG: zinc-binding alcohol dehydrogenase family protein [Acidobacteriaceae bacterium]
MKALVMHGPGDLRVESVAEPQVRTGKALLRVRRVGLCGSDLNSYRGRNPLMTYPRIPGHEIAATIMALSEPHPEFSTGMDVTLAPYSHCGACSACRNGRPNACESNETMGVQRDGALTEYLAVPIEKLYRANLSLNELCLVEPLTVGAHAVARGVVRERDKVAIFGCGGVGLGAVAASAFRGAVTIAIDVNDDKLALAREAGANYTIHSHREELGSALSAIVGPDGPDVIIEAVGMAESFRAAVELISFTGRVVYIGYAKEPVTYETRLFVQKELDIRGTRNALPEDFRQVIRMLEEGRFPVASVIDRVAPLDEAPDLLAAWSAHPSQFKKIMITLD